MSSGFSPQLKAFRAAWPYTLPILAGYGFLGITKGIYMSSMGLGVLMSFLTGIIIYGGSVEFLTAGLLIAAFDPLAAFLMALMLSVRQIFYGISMLDRYRDLGAKRWYLIYTLSDETFAINYSAHIPDGVDPGWFMFFVSLLNQSYWVVACTLGALLGDFIPFSTEGIEFVMTTVFTVIFLDQWLKDRAAGRGHLSALTGIVTSVLCLMIFGTDGFILPAMILILCALTALSAAQRPALASAPGDRGLTKDGDQSASATEGEPTEDLKAEGDAGALGGSLSRGHTKSGGDTP